MITPGQQRQVAPYAPGKLIDSFFDRIRRIRAPDTVDSNLLLDYGVSKSQVFAVLGTLKFLQLIAPDGTPTAEFRALQTEGDEFRSALRSIVETAYATVFERLDVSTATRDQMKNYFNRNYSPATADRAIALFLHLCNRAGIAVQTGAQSRRPTTSSQSARKTRASSSSAKPSILPVHAPTTPSGRVVLELRLTQDDLDAMDTDDISAVFAAAGRIEVARRKARAREAQSGLGEAVLGDNG